MTAAFLGALFGALVAAGIAYTYVRHILLPKAAALEAAGFQTTLHGRTVDGVVAMPPVQIEIAPCAVATDILTIRRACSCPQCKAHVLYEDTMRGAA
jgi:hypothetical protein